MKRQRPDNPDLFWCPVCEKYYQRNYFSSLHDYKPCKYCLPVIATNRTEYNFSKELEYSRRYAATHKKESSERYNWNKKHLRDPYIKALLQTKTKTPDKETIELKRQEVIMKRTMKELKKWRKENDPTITNVPGIKSENEKADECP